MTIEEAKEQLWELIHDRESFIVGDSDEEIYRKDIEALKKALELFEKQIPKKPISLPDGHPFYYEIRDCPFCEESVYVAEGEFCPSCGQALDWSDSND